MKDSDLVAYIPLLLALVAFRAVPFAGYLLVAPHATSPRTRALFLACTGALLFATLYAPLDAFKVVAVAPLVLFYFGLLACLVYVLSRTALTSFGGKPLLLLAALFVSVIVPATVLEPPILVPVLVLGFDFALSAYSYSVDTAAGSRPHFDECLFFLLVNPTLVFAERGHRVASTQQGPRGVGRILLGSFALMVQQTILVKFASSTLSNQQDIRNWTEYVLVVVASWVQLTAMYCAHSGLASVQIGMMRVCGHQIPERYHYPLLAFSPETFWRRWNIWLGSWARRYLYFPFMFGIARSLKRRHNQIAKAIAVILTFVVVGLLHDIVGYCSRAYPSAWEFGGFPVAGAFSLIGASFVVWFMFERALRFIVRRFRDGRVSPPVVRVFQWLLFAQLAALLTYVVVPSLSGGTLPRPITAFVGSVRSGR